MSDVRSLTVEAPSLKRAREIEGALKEFERELLADDGRYVVHVSVPSSDHGLVDVLSSLERYVQEHGNGAAHFKVELDGKSYVLDVPTKPGSGGSHV